MTLGVSLRKKAFSYLKGQADVGLVLGTVVGLIAVSMTVIIGLMLFESFKGSINRDNWGTICLNNECTNESFANNSFDSIVTNHQTGFDLVTIAPILMAAGVVISLLLGFALIARSVR